MSCECRVDKDLHHASLRCVLKKEARQANEKSSEFQKEHTRDGVKKRRDKPGMGLEAHFMT